jgi:hypothetical protein
LLLEEMQDSATHIHKDLMQIEIAAAASTA